ncbi:hypothetical protein FA13DRAFT_1741873 [Coprinellus micaceus]|uniref:Uncharacterized protein n=1 Tax=Coprinellus micaceus TaxID=71717 RepID=A0A4Y7SIQ2_COPMI|nr:hypothetical protein FA13DRAFT_1741873 [Coprinellus micaceus]
MALVSPSLLHRSSTDHDTTCLIDRLLGIALRYRAYSLLNPRSFRSHPHAMHRPAQPFKTPKSHLSR